MNFLQEIADEMERREGGNKPQILPEALQEDLRNKLKSFQTVHNFDVGQLIRAKDAADPKGGCFGIVVLAGEDAKAYFQKLPEHYRNDYNKTECDLIVGVIDQDDGEFVLTPQWSRWFEPWPDEGSQS